MTDTHDGRPHSPRVLAAATVHGYSVAFSGPAAILAGGAILLAILLPSIKSTGGPTAPPSPIPEPELTPEPQVGSGRA